MLDAPVGQRVGLLITTTTRQLNNRLYHRPLHIRRLLHQDRGCWEIRRHKFGEGRRVASVVRRWKDNQRLRLMITELFTVVILGGKPTSIESTFRVEITSDGLVLFSNTPKRTRKEWPTVSRSPSLSSVEKHPPIPDLSLLPCASTRVIPARRET